MPEEADRQVEQGRAGGSDLDFEKYIVPGACAVGILILFPWYLLGGGRLGTWDLGTVAIIGLVAGHFIESLKVYRWGPRVRRNLAEFDSSVGGLFSTLTAGKKLTSAEVDRAKAIVFTMMQPAESSEFVWNLVRWQKMIALAAISATAGCQWLFFAAMTYAAGSGRNVFRSDFRLAVFKAGADVKYSCPSEVLLAAALFGCAAVIYHFGTSRQRKNNDTYYELIYRHKDKIFEILQRGSEGDESTQRDKR